MSELPARPEMTFVPDGEDASVLDQSGFEVAAVPEAAVAPGEHIGKFEVVSKLGEGGMGAVYKAHDPAIDRDVAIKVLGPRLAANEAAVKRFEAEGRAAGKVAHPNVVAVHEVGRLEDGGLPFLVMEFVRGGCVEDLIEGGKTVPPVRAVEIVADACAGLAAAHQVGLIHRDVKPANLMLETDGSVKVADFGLARQTKSGDPRLTQAARIVGTPHFMSPEQCSGQEVDARADVYSLGATFYALLRGQSPFESAGSMMDILAAHLHQETPEVHADIGGVPPAVTRLIRRAMAKDPAGRYGTAEEMLIDLEALLEMLADESLWVERTYRGATMREADEWRLPSERSDESGVTRTVSERRSKSAKRSAGSSIVKSMFGGRAARRRKSEATAEAAPPKTAPTEETPAAAAPADHAAVVLPEVVNPPAEGVAREVFSVAGGEFVLLRPTALAAAEVADVAAWLDLVKAKVLREAGGSGG